MTLAEFSQIAQSIGSAAVIASLIFVGVELRQNAKATRAASHHAVTGALNEINLLWARNAEATKIWLEGLTDRRSLASIDQWRFDGMLRAYLHVCETMYMQARLGAGDPGIVAAEEDGIRRVFSSPGVQEWWMQNPFGFSSEFRKHVLAITSVS